MPNFNTAIRLLRCPQMAAELVAGGRFADAEVHIRVVGHPVDDVVENLDLQADDLERTTTTAARFPGFLKVAE